MKTERTGWFEENGGWFFYHKGNPIADFHLDDRHMIYHNMISGIFGEAIVLSLDEAKSIVENGIISYCAEQTSDWSEMRYSVVKTAGERMNNND